MRTVQAGGRRWPAIVALMAVVAVIGSGAPSASAKQSQDGPYAIGMRSYTFVDKSRPTAPNGTYAGAPSRKLPTMLLYPAKGKAGGAAVENARPLAIRRGFPLVVFSHGFGANGPAYKPLLELLVRRGYVVAAPTFPLSSSGAPGGPKLGDYVNQPGDVSYVITRVLRLRRNHRGLAKTISRDHIGVGGHSLGAITTFGVATNSCCLDRRIDAAVPISGILLPYPNGTFFSKPTPPLLVIHGNQGWNGALLGQRRRLQPGPRTEGAPDPRASTPHAVPAAVAGSHRANHHRLPRRLSQERSHGPEAARQGRQRGRCRVSAAEAVRRAMR